METNKNIEAVSAETRQQWRQWLENNSQSKTEICLILYSKVAEKQSISYGEAVEEALCFGWIDSLTNKRDAESRYQRFSPRKPKSNWSKSNVERAERMIQAGLMTEYGQKMIAIAKETGRWEVVVAE